MCPGSESNIAHTTHCVPLHFQIMAWVFPFEGVSFSRSRMLLGKAIRQNINGDTVDSLRHEYFLVKHTGILHLHIFQIMETEKTQEGLTF